jgi:hypothetical protein
MSASQSLLPHGDSPWWILAQVVGRILCILLGVGLFFPSVMMGDSGRTYATAVANTLVVCCLLFVIAGVIGSLKLFCFALTVYVTVLLLVYIFVDLGGHATTESDSDVASPSKSNR